ncbi:MAG: hypothetical protein AB4372_03520 [Xenococcus sp. (in: cyanobacteria)]
MLHSNTTSTSTQLFTDLTAEEGSSISGGAGFEAKLVAQEDVIKINNKTYLPVYLDLHFGDQRYQDFRLEPGQSHYFTGRADQATTDYDEDFGTPGIQLKTDNLKAYYQYDFSLEGNKLNLYAGGSIA